MTDKKHISASKARSQFSELISQVEYQNKEFLIERYGEVVAKIVPVSNREAKLDTQPAKLDEQTTSTQQEEPATKKEDAKPESIKKEDEAERKDPISELQRELEALLNQNSRSRREPEQPNVTRETTTGVVKKDETDSPKSAKIIQRRIKLMLDN